MRKINLILILGILLIGGVLASETSYCCERLVGNDGTTPGSWCQDAERDQCAEGFQSVPTSCEATSFCKGGTCIDISNGGCRENVGEAACLDSDDSIWDNRDSSEVPQCQLGCCLIGDQAAFTTHPGCKKIGSDYGTDLIFRPDITSEIECLANAKPNVRGACVFEKEFERTCRMVTKKECQDMEIGIESSNTKFHEGVLCTANDLNTNCARTERTTCVEGKDEIYYLDTCGNTANVYDSTKHSGTDEYWDKIQYTDCDPAITPKTCGNCNYLDGSVCGKASILNQPEHGGNICKDLDCTWKGEPKEHGESWCADSSGTSSIKLNEDNLNINPRDIINVEENLPGSRYTRLVCYNGEVMAEPCDDFRQQICVETEVEGQSGEKFTFAGCRINIWQDCVHQINEKDCTNTDRRDCRWIEIPGYVSCTPLFSPGYNFWEIEDEGNLLCGLASETCVVKYKKSIWNANGLKDWTCIENCHCADPSWPISMNNLCTSLGDCGSKGNYKTSELGYDPKSKKPKDRYFHITDLFWEGYGGPADRSEGSDKE